MVWNGLSLLGPSITWGETKEIGENYIEEIWVYIIYIYEYTLVVFDMGELVDCIQEVCSSHFTLLRETEIYFSTFLTIGVEQPCHTVLYLRNQIGNLGLGLPQLPGWIRDDGTGSYTGVETEWDCVMRTRVITRASYLAAATVRWAHVLIGLDWIGWS